MNGEIILGHAASLFAQNNPNLAIEQLEVILKENPAWIDGHRSLSMIKGQVGDGSGYDASLISALKKIPQDMAVRQALINANIQANDWQEAERNIKEALGIFPNEKWLCWLAAFTASELGDHLAADQLFKDLGKPQNVQQVSWLMRHYLRAGSPMQALDAGEAWIGQDNEGLLWPYFALGWRLTANPRWKWLEGDENYIQVFDISSKIPCLNKLAEVIRAIHIADHQPIDQSLRSGTQTDGPLFSRIEPEIRMLRSAVLDAVKTYVQNLPKYDANHPLLIKKRTPLRFAGSWSVRLSSQGFHVDHVHTHGWISSALYIALPANAIGDGSGKGRNEGWLSFGENRALVPDLEPFRLVKPKPGQLVLFPSTMWHGTRPFNDGKRLTIAFDIARPAQ